MTRKALFFIASALALVSCDGVKEPANVENVVAYTRVGDIGALMVDAIEIKLKKKKDNQKDYLDALEGQIKVVEEK